MIPGKIIYHRGNGWWSSLSRKSSLWPRWWAPISAVTSVQEKWSMTEMVGGDSLIPSFITTGAWNVGLFVSPSHPRMLSWLTGSRFPGKCTLGKTAEQRADWACLGDSCSSFPCNHSALPQKRSFWHPPAHLRRSVCLRCLHSLACSRNVSLSSSGQSVHVPLICFFRCLIKDQTSAANTFSLITLGAPESMSHAYRCACL